MSLLLVIASWTLGLPAAQRLRGPSCVVISALIGSSKAFQFLKSCPTQLLLSLLRFSPCHWHVAL